MDLAEVPVEATFGLRSGVLGWATPRTRIDGEDARHLALVAGAGIVAVVSHVGWACPDEPGLAARYFWAMAVDPAVHRTGCGRRLLAALAGLARGAGEAVLWADARESAVGFYVACGAAVKGDPYADEVTGLTDRRVVFTL